MRNYIILNGTNSNTINGLLIQELAPISKPLQRTEIEEIDGRDGDIITPLGFSAYDKEITIGLHGNFDINQIIAFFNSEGTVTFSNEPDKYYNYTIYQQIDFERLVRFKTATVTLHCQPFKFATTGESQTLSSGNPISDEGTNLVLEGSALAPFSQFDLKGNTEQTGDPTPDAPIPVATVTGYNEVRLCGKNLVKIVAPTTTTNGVTFTANDDGTYTANGTATAAINFYLMGSTWIDAKAGTYTASDGVESGESNTTFFTFVDGGNGYKIENQPTTFTLAADTNIRMRFVIRVGATLNNVVFKPMIEKSSQATSFEPYQGQSYEVNLGKNLFDKSAATLGEWLLTDGSTQSSPDYDTSDFIPVIAGQSYFLPMTKTRRFKYYNASKVALTNTWDINSSDSGQTVTIPSGAYYVRFSIDNRYVDINTFQFERGIQATSYAGYFAPVELCKLHDYQDYIYKSGDKWYIHKEVGKAILDGTESWTDSSTSGYSYVRGRLQGFSGLYALCYCDKFTRRTGSHGEYEYIWIQAPQTGDLYVQISDSRLSSHSLAAFKTWLSENKPAIYYVLATPVEEEITNAALIEQLNNINNQAHAYKERTHVSSTYATGNVPHIIAATVVGDASGTITNAGNIYSKPKLTVYGSGDIGIYLNGVQMFQITLGSLGNITIDTAAMEAYTGTIDNLQNRAVTGDYSNFKLPVGQNKISFSGIVTSCTIENFSRWL